MSDTKLKHQKNIKFSPWGGIDMKSGVTLSRLDSSYAKIHIGSGIGTYHLIVSIDDLTDLADAIRDFLEPDDA
jgi:hypothetical protein